jgi:hypothetical protein
LEYYLNEDYKKRENEMNKHKHLKIRFGKRKPKKQIHEILAANL